MERLLILAIPLALYAVTVLPGALLFVFVRRRWQTPSVLRLLCLAALASLAFTPVLLHGHVPGLAPLAVALVLRLLRGQPFDLASALLLAALVFVLALALLWRARGRRRRSEAAP